MNQHKREDGFTLVEVIVTISILGILFAIAVPMYINYQNRAKITAVKSDIASAVSIVERNKGMDDTYRSTFSDPLTPDVTVNVKLRCDDANATSCNELFGDKPCVEGWHDYMPEKVYHYDMETRMMNEGACPAT